MSVQLNVNNVNGNGALPPSPGTATPSPSDQRIQQAVQAKLASHNTKKPASCCDRIKAIPVIGHIIRAIIWIFEQIFSCCDCDETPSRARNSIKEYEQSITPQKMKSLINALSERTNVLAVSVKHCPTDEMADLVSLSALFEDLKILLGDLTAFEAQFKIEPSSPSPNPVDAEPINENRKKCQALIPQAQKAAQTVVKLIADLKTEITSRNADIQKVLATARKDIVNQEAKCRANPADDNERILLEYNFYNYYNVVRSLNELGVITPDTDPAHQQILVFSNGVQAKSKRVKPQRLWAQKAAHNAQSIRLRSPDSLGINNIGNSCYMNSGLQNLLGAPDFAQMVLAPLVRKPKEKDAEFQARGFVQTALQAVLEAMRSGDDDLVEEGMKTLRATIFSDFSRLHLDTDLKRRPGVRDAMYAQHDGEAFISTALLVLGHQLQCQEVREFVHGGIPHTHNLAGVDSNTMLRLTLLQGGGTLQQTFDSYFSAKMVNDPKNSFNYPLNGGSVKISNYSTRSRIVGAIPELLAVQLKRFKFDELSTNGPEKIFDKVVCGNGGKVDVTDYVDPALRRDQSRIEYQVVGFQLHHGQTPTGGHYTGCRLCPDGNWRHYNDGTVKTITQAEAENMMSKAYCLTLARVH